MASGTSKEAEIKLLYVARLWAKDSKAALFVGKLAGRKDVSYETYGTYIESWPADVVANILICLIHQANYLPNQQIRQLEKAFLKEGGLRERMAKARIAARRRET